MIVISCPALRPYPKRPMPNIANIPRVIMVLLPFLANHKTVMFTELIIPPPRIVGALSDLSVAYIGRNSRTERPRKTKIGTEIAHITHDSDSTFKIKRSKVKVTRPLYSPRP